MSPSSYKAALKHGLYARRLTKKEIELIGVMPVLNIEGEIGYQRALIARIGEILENNGLAPGSSEGLTEDTRKTMKLLNDTMTKLLSYLRVHNMLKGDLTEYREEVERGKMIGRERRHVFDYFKSPQELASRDEAAHLSAQVRDGSGSAKPRKRSKRTGAPAAKKSDGHA